MGVEFQFFSRAGAAAAAAGFLPASASSSLPATSSMNIPLPPSNISCIIPCTDTHTQRVSIEQRSTEENYLPFPVPFMSTIPSPIHEGAMILRNLFFCLLQFLFEVNLLREQGYERRTVCLLEHCCLLEDVVLNLPFASCPKIAGS